jgi:NAD(P)-dependent dehydrogenase (short-subunit alcohol dehydrogenase family)
LPVGSACIDLDVSLIYRRGAVDTPMSRKFAAAIGGELDLSHAAIKRVANPDELPPLIEFLLSDAASFISGAAISIDGGWHC